MIRLTHIREQLFMVKVPNRPETTVEIDDKTWGACSDEDTAVVLNMMDMDELAAHARAAIRCGSVRW